MSFKYIRSGQTNSEPMFVSVKLANSAAVAVGTVVTVSATGFAAAGPATTIGTKYSGVVSNLFVQNGPGSQTIPPTSASGISTYTAPANNQTRFDATYAEIIIDQDAIFEADWDVTPTTNSLLTGAYVNVNTNGLTLANASSTAPQGVQGNFVILASNASALKALIKFIPAQTYFYS